jgi:hypothetical protein
VYLKDDGGVLAREAAAADVILDVDSFTQRERERSE